MQVLHAPAALSAVFDDPNLVSCAGLAPLLALATRAGLAELTTRHVRLSGEQGANPGLKVPALAVSVPPSITRRARSPRTAPPINGRLAVKAHPPFLE